MRRDPEARAALAGGLAFECESAAGKPAPPVALAFRDQDTAVDTGAFAAALAGLLEGG